MVNFKNYDVTAWLKTITIHILRNISRSKGNQTMKFNHLVDYNKKNFFFKNRAENEAVRLVPDLFLLCKKALREVKASGLQLSFNIFLVFNLAYSKNKMQKLCTIDPGLRSILRFLEMGLAMVSPPYVVCDFSRKMFLMLYSIN